MGLLLSEYISNIEFDISSDRSAQISNLTSVLQGIVAFKRHGELAREGVHTPHNKGAEKSRRGIG